MKKAVLLLLFFLNFTGQSQQLKPLQLILAMHDSIEAIKTVRFKVVAVERIQGNYVKVVSENKIQTKPRKLYLLNREKKLEILYVEGVHNNKAVVKPNIFPYFTLTLNPQGSLMRKNQHYSINELGFDFIGKTIELALSKEKENIAKSISYIGMQTKNGHKCHLFVYETEKFIYTDYITKDKETVASITAKLHVNDYIIRTKNNLYGEFGNLKTGTKLKVPLYYCKKAVFYLDEKTLLPVNVSVFDDIGLLENYDFTDIILNKPIDPKEFTEDYKDYHF